MITGRRAQHFHELVGSESTGGVGLPERTDLLDVVQALRAVPAPAPDPAFVAVLRDRLIAEAESVLAAAAAERDDTESRPRLRPTGPLTRRRHRRLAAVVGGVALVGASATMAVAAQSALPGEGLYPIKRGLENAHAELTFDRADRGRVVLDNAGTRLDEAQELSREQADPTRVSGALDAFAEQAIDGSDLLIADYQATGDRSSMTTLRMFTVASMDRLKLLQSQVPPQSYDSLLQAAQALDQVQQTSVQTCSVCDGPLISSVPDVLARARRATVDTWQVVIPKPPQHDRPASDSSGGPSLPPVKRDDPPPVVVADPGASSADPGQSPADEVEHTVHHLTHDLQNPASTGSDTTDDLLESVGQDASDVGSDVAGTPDGTIGDIDSPLPTLP